MVVQHNMQAANASRTLNITTDSQSKSTEKLSSGYKINRAADDAAGLSISEKMRKQIRGLTQASTNASDGVSSVQTAEGALTEVHDMLQRMNELAVQAANGTNSESDRDDIQNEINQLTQEIDRIASTTKFNETFLLKGDIGLKRMYINAHDAGLDGTLIQNTTKATFTMESLEAGEKYRIGGIQYTIGATTNEEAAKALHLESYYKKGATDTDPGTWSIPAGDTISIDGKTYTINPDGVGTDVANAKVTNGYLNKLITEGSVIKYNGNEVQRFSTSYNKATGIDDANVTLIKATAAYNMIATELKAASSVGATDGAAQLVDMDDANENGGGAESVWEKAVISKIIGGDRKPTKVTSISFTLMKGYVNIQNALTLNLHVGADAAMTNKINVTLEAMNAKSIGINGLNVSDATGKAATYAIDAIADAIQRVSAQRAELGAIQNRLEHSIRNLDNVVENTEAAESRIRDTDMADTMVEYSKNNILQQAGQSMLAQANQATQGVMNLLQ
ncbi:flagellin N-terminal helical domain-containing protein [Pseudobutyrivibrio xylanivorans]|uniref:Flagellin n=1 Tax=Pseudobutyrivibrio xylanivorans DSM 14809 TaxID=1123012 RepID=A0A1M6GZA4_PSEXY|nr:flagellin [Pseudobutyrivibrio xylanivorans]SHJ15298.1 flagellin [Pseudobutyrivibrio xylanivorans DSM 14809]